MNEWVEWQFDAGSQVDSSPTVVDGLLFVGSRDGHLYALNAETGVRRWTFKTESRVQSSPTVADGTVFFGSHDGHVYARETRTGKYVWTFDSSGPVGSSPTVADGTVYVGSDDGHVYALDAETGKRVWAFETHRSVRSSPTVADGLVFVGSHDGHLYALDSETGTRQWALKTDGSVWSSPTVAEGVVIVGSKDSYLYAQDVETGRRAWISKTDDAVTSSPTVADGLVFVGSYDDHVYARDAETGQRAWSFETDGPIWSAPTIADDTVFVGSYDHHVYALDVATGTREWAFETGQKICSSPTVVDGTLFVGNKDGTIYAIDAGVQGSSEDSRVLLGTLGHHDLPRQAVSGTDRRASQTDRRQPSGRSGSRISGSRKSNGTQSTAEPASIPTAPQISLSYDDLRKDELVARSGNADVYRATAPGPDEELTVALKEPRAGGTVHYEVAERLLAEAETWTTLQNHDHIVSIVDYGVESAPWIAMEFMDGGHLGERTGELPLERALWTAVAMTSAIHHAHRHGVVHLDIKPENVLFKSARDGRDVPKVADWGLSKHLLEHSRSMEGFTAHYAAPEQFDDDYGPTDDRTDIYQLGAVLYELVTNDPPFEGPPASVMNQVLTDTPTPPSELADVPPALDDIILTALAKDRTDRYESVLYLRDDLLDLYDSL